MAKTSIIIGILKKYNQIPRLANDEGEWSFLSEQLFRLIFYKSFAASVLPTFKKIEYVRDANNDIKMKANLESGGGVSALHGSASLFRTSCEPNVDMNIGMNMPRNLLTVRALTYIPRGTELLAPQLLV